MLAISREGENALDTAWDRPGRAARVQGAAAARTHRDAAATASYTTHLAPHVDQLLQAARHTLDQLPPARHTDAWRALLASLAASQAAIRRLLAQQAAPGSDAERQRNAAAWPHLAFWAEHGAVVETLAALDLRQTEPDLTNEERRTWTQKAHAAQRRRELDLIESWYAPDGRRVTLASVFGGNTDTVVALTGDPHSPDWEVIGHFGDIDTAREALPPPVPPGMLRPDASMVNRPEPHPEVSLRVLMQDIVAARTAGNVADTLLTLTQPDPAAGPALLLTQLVSTAAQFASALESMQAQQVAARLGTLARQLSFLTNELQDAAEDLGATVAVLPPHRIPSATRLAARTALTIASSTAPPRSSAAPFSRHHR
ncbi:hypothetical protein [Streptomyces sp. NPDC004682]